MRVVYEVTLITCRHHIFHIVSSSRFHASISAGPCSRPRRHRDILMPCGPNKGLSSGSVGRTQLTKVTFTTHTCRKGRNFGRHWSAAVYVVYVHRNGERSVLYTLVEPSAKLGLNEMLNVENTVIFRNKIYISVTCTDTLFPCRQNIWWVVFSCRLIRWSSCQRIVFGLYNLQRKSIHNKFSYFIGQLPWHGSQRTPRDD